ncbi:MAG: rRNA maturation RNase YbeY [SAR324 cluster bacterium]|nr:rRNA maturation RNase YbeY [SAR324 cluster bacterium]
MNNAPMDISWADSCEPPLSTEEIREHIQEFLQILGHSDRQISLYFTNDMEIQEFNSRYRNQNKPTDVLSWSYWENDPNSEILGEIVISVDQVQKQADTNHWPESTELIRLLAHGCAHLVGYDHEISLEEEKKMLLMEIKMLGAVGLDNIYEMDK